MGRLQISELARRSGFAPSTLRYYEQLGLLPDVERSPSGYRLYGDDAVQRLAVIGRAKRMGFTLDEIADLIELWAGGECGSVQERLRAGLAEKLNRARHELAELSNFAGQLQAIHD
ncbi:MAG: MerR family transcriptional regulator, partial [Acidimicrobiales bacterium]